MKKILLIVLIALSLILCVFAVLNGFTIGKIEILSYKGIQQKNAQLDAKIQEASKLAEKDYQQTLSTLTQNFKELQKQKSEYEEMTQVSTESEIQSANQLQRYEIETLWVKLGNYATSEGVVIKMDIARDSSTAEGNYNLNFTVNGTYISITDFISDIENDSTLGFKIENFRMIPSVTNSELQATFSCKDIAIHNVSQAAVNTGTTNDVDRDNTGGNTTSNTTNTNTTGNTTSNTTNSTTNNTARNTANETD